MTTKLEWIQQRFTAFCYNHFFPEVHYCYSLALEELKSHTLRIMRQRLNALSLIQVYLDSKFCPFVLEIVGLRVPARYIRDFPLSNVCSSCKHWPPARCESAANVACRDVKLFVMKKVLLNNILKYVIIIIIIIIKCPSMYVCLCILSFLVAYWHNKCKCTYFKFLTC
jgi:hypothetical protein